MAHARRAAYRRPGPPLYAVAMEPFTIALCQVRAREIDEAEENLQAILAALDRAGDAGAQLVALPECAYPAYYLRGAHAYERPEVRPYDEVCRLLGEKAHRYGYWLAAGLAVPHPEGRLSNSGVVFGPDGEIRGQYDKQFLWHFDNNWFEPGREFPVWDAGFCRFGILICADSRQPEIARSLYVNGAELIVDLTAWVSTGRTVQELTTTQCQYLMPARAYENGVWVAACDKWGSEDGTIVYAGRSSVIDPLGQTLVCAPSDADEVVVYTIDPQDAAPPVPRRPALYSMLTMPQDELPILSLMREPMVPADEDRRVAVVPGDGAAFDAGTVVARYEALRAQDVDFMVFAGVTGPEGWQVDLPPIETAVRGGGGSLLLGVASDGCAPSQSAVLVTPDRTVEHLASHGRGINTGETLSPVIETPAGNVGILCGDEGLVPEVARCLMLQGADILAWTLFEADPMAEVLGRARSDENKVYTAAAWPDGGVIAEPSGGPMVHVPAGTGVAMAAQVNRAVARWKDRAPGTNMVRDRIPGAYGALVR
jgi:predicted amidohydrolase